MNNIMIENIELNLETIIPLGLVAKFNEKEEEITLIFQENDSKYLVLCKCENSHQTVSKKNNTIDLEKGIFTSQDNYNYDFFLIKKDISSMSELG